ncbi:MAG TPA: hypothetical protein VEV42_02815, partial [Pyrinomonadaceae bacterium]|nr:hypothetical protein [Pyrinomonadaceae bacterium]
MTSSKQTIEVFSGIAPARAHNAERSSGFLYRGIKNLLRCDEAEMVEGIAHYVISQHRALRILAFLAKRSRNSILPGLIAMIGWLRSFLSVRWPERREGVAWIARLSNERRAIEPLVLLAPDLRWTELKFFSLLNVGSLKLVIGNSSARHLFRIVRRLHRRHEFFKVLRVVEFIAYYARYRDIFQNSQFSLAVMSSHSNPHGIAFNMAAQANKIPIALISHGMPVRPVARLSYDLAVVHCEAARQTYFEEGCRIGRVFTHGRSRHYAPMPSGNPPQSFAVGIFLCKDVNDVILRALVSQLLLRSEVSRIVVRPHPKNLWVGINQWATSLAGPRFTLSLGQTVFSDIQMCDVVFAGNSSVLVDAVTAGKPAGYVANLDYGPYDVHQFLKCGLIYSVDEQRGVFKWNTDEIWRFYQRSPWLNVLRL